jgi:hypothetical protein
VSIPPLEALARILYLLVGGTLEAMSLRLVSVSIMSYYLFLT